MSKATFNGPPSQWNRYFAKREYGAAGAKLVDCATCGKKRLGLGGPHAPHFLAGELVDCVGRPVR